MTEQVEVIPPTECLFEAAKRMRSLDVGALPVCDGDRLVGMLTDRDLTIRAVAEGLDPLRTPVEEAMTPGIAWCYEDQDAVEAEQLMQERQIRRLPILNRDERLVGIVSLADISTKCGDREGTARTLERISEPVG